MNLAECKILAVPVYLVCEYPLRIAAIALAILLCGTYEDIALIVWIE